MISKDLENLLSLLAAMIIADKRTFAEEIQSFLRETRKLQTALGMKPIQSEAKVLLWYEMNKTAVEADVCGPEFETWLYDCLDRLAHVEDKQTILNVMTEIALADDELHVSEQALMVLTARHWNLDIAA